MLAVTIPDFWAGVAATIIVELLLVAVIVASVIYDSRAKNDEPK